VRKEIGGAPRVKAQVLAKLGRVTPIIGEPTGSKESETQLFTLTLETDEGRREKRRQSNFPQHNSLNPVQYKCKRERQWRGSLPGHQTVEA